MLRALLYAAVAGVATHAAAQSAPPKPASAPGLTYESAFTTYRPYSEEPAADWRTVNDEVGRVGGHVGIVGGASGHGGHGSPRPSAGRTEAGQPPVRGAPAAPAGSGHAGHR